MSYYGYVKHPCGHPVNWMKTELGGDWRLEQRDADGKPVMVCRKCTPVLRVDDAPPNPEHQR